MVHHADELSSPCGCGLCLRLYPRKELGADFTGVIAGLVGVNGKQSVAAVKIDRIAVGFFVNGIRVRKTCVFINLAESGDRRVL